MSAAPKIYPDGTAADPFATPRIYAACLAAYNAGHLHGRWIDATQGAEHIQTEISAMLKESPEYGAEEYAIHDYENFEGLRLGEWPDLEFAAAAGELLTTGDGDTIIALHSHLGGKDTVAGLEESKAYFEEHYAGTARTLEDWAEDFARDSGEEIPERWAPYIDWEKYARDLELGGDVFTLEGGAGVLVFWNR